MKKLICAAFVAASMLAMAEESKTQATPAAAKSAETAKQAPRRVKMTDEQRAQMKARREQFMAQRKAAMEAKLLEVVKKYVPEEEKAKALVAELQEAMTSARRGGMRPNRPAKPAAEAK